MSFSDSECKICIPDVQLFELLGRGGMADVYRAINLEREVAVKVLKQDSLDALDFKRFQREAQSAAQLQHPNIIIIHRFGISGAYPYMVMELLDGGSLSDHLKLKGRLSIAEVLEVFPPLLSALHYAHTYGIVHRDLKPANIMFQKLPDTDLVPKLVDFGIARQISPANTQTQLTQDGSILGSPAYMSPEQCAGSDLDARSDVYSMAVVIYECLTGKLPFDCDTVLELLYAHANAPRPSPRQIARQNRLPLRLMACVIKGLAINREDRFASAAEFAEALITAAAPTSSQRVLARQLIIGSSVIIAIVFIFILAIKKLDRMKPLDPHTGSVTVGLGSRAQKAAAQQLANAVTECSLNLSRMTEAKKASKEADRIYQSGKNSITEWLKLNREILNDDLDPDYQHPWVALINLAQAKGGNELMEIELSKAKEENKDSPPMIHHISRAELSARLNNHTAKESDLIAQLNWDRAPYEKHYANNAGNPYYWDLTRLIMFYVTSLDKSYQSQTEKQFTELQTVLLSANLPPKAKFSLCSAAVTAVASEGTQQYAQLGVNIANKILNSSKQDCVERAELMRVKGLCCANLGRIAEARESFNYYLKHAPRGSYIEQTKSSLTALEEK